MSFNYYNNPSAYGSNAGGTNNSQAAGGGGSAQLAKAIGALSDQMESNQESAANSKAKLSDALDSLSQAAANQQASKSQKAAGTQQASMGQTLASLSKLLQQQNAAESSGDGDSADNEGQDQGSSLGGSLGALTGAIMGLVSGVRRLHDHFNKMADDTLALNQQLGNYNGTIAVANAQAQAASMVRASRQGAMIGESYARLSAAQSEYQDLRVDAMDNLQNAAMSIQARIAEIRNNILGQYLLPLIKKLDPILDSVAEWFGSEGTDDTVNNNLPAAHKFLSDVSDGRFDGFGTEYMNPGNRPLYSVQERQNMFGSGGRKTK